VLFYEYFHGDNGAGIGAAHQTGWTGTVALLPLLFRGRRLAGDARIPAPREETTAPASRRAAVSR
jgi:hypothetical protein